MRPSLPALIDRSVNSFLELSVLRRTLTAGLLYVHYHTRAWKRWNEKESPEHVDTCSVCDCFGLRPCSVHIHPIVFWVHHEAPAPARTLKTGHGSFSATTRGSIANRTQHTRFVRDSLTSPCPWCGTVVMKLAATARIRPTTAVYCVHLNSIDAGGVCPNATACLPVILSTSSSKNGFVCFPGAGETPVPVACEKPHFSSFSPSLAQCSLHQSGVTETLRKWPCQRQHVWRSTGCSS